MLTSTMRRVHAQPCSGVQKASGALVISSYKAKGMSARPSAALSSHVQAAPHPQPLQRVQRARRRAGAAPAATQGAQTAMAVGTEPSVEFLGVLNGMQTVKGVLHVAAPPERVWTIITDYESNSRVYENISDSQVLMQEDGSKQLLQACRWQFLAFSGTFDVQLAVQEDADAMLLVFRLVRSSFMNDFEGRWQVSASPEIPGGSQIEHVLGVKPLMPIPAPVSTYTKPIFTRQVGAILADLGRELAAQSAQSMQQAAASRR